MRIRQFQFLFLFSLLSVAASAEPVVISAPDNARTFGSAAAIEKNVLVIGAARADVNDNQYQGAAYVFEYFDNEWQQRAKLLAPNGAAEDYFGTQVAIKGDTIAISAPRENVSGLERAGAVHVFRNIDNEWRHAARVTAEDPQAFDRFGQQLAMNNGTIMVSKLREASATVRPEGAIYFFAYEPGRAQWQQVTKCLPPAEYGPVFGNSIAIDNDIAIASVMNDGVVMMYARDDAVWRERGRLQLPKGDGVPPAMITQVALQGDTVVAGAPMQPAAEEGGANGQVFVLETEQSAGEPVAVRNVVELASPDPENVQYGWTLQLHEDVLAVMPQYDDMAYLYQQTDAGWQSYATMSAADLVASDAAVLALSNEHLVMRGDNTVLLFAMPEVQIAENSVVSESGDAGNEPAGDSGDDDATNSGSNDPTAGTNISQAQVEVQGGGGAASVLVALLVGSCGWRKVKA